jgi:hypothetical protein
MSYIEEHWQPGDVAYVYHHLRAAFQYYALRYVFNPNDYVLGKDEREHWENQKNEAYVKDLDQLRGKRRIWFVFSYVRSIKGVNEEDYFVQCLDRIGKRVDQVNGIGASVYLYDLSYRQPVTPNGIVSQ